MFFNFSNLYYGYAKMEANLIDQSPPELSKVTVTQSHQQLFSNAICIQLAQSENRAIRNRILLCWLTLTIPLLLYLKLRFWDGHGKNDSIHYHLHHHHHRQFSHQ